MKHQLMIEGHVVSHCPQRSVTLKNRMKKKAISIPITLDFEEVENSLACGLRIKWLTATNEGTEIEVTSGAGVGSPWMCCSVKNVKTGKRKELRCDIRQLAKTLFKLAEERK